MSGLKVCRWVERQWLPAAVGIGLIGAPLWGLVIDGEPPIAIRDARAPEPQALRGGALKLVYTVERFRLCPGEIQRIIVDGQGLLHLIERYEVLAEPPAPAAGLRLAPARRAGLDEPAAATTPPPILGLHDLAVSAPVPIGAAPGPARYQAIIHYYCNWVQRLFGQPSDVRTPVIDFTILPDAAARPDPPVRLPNAAPAPPPPADQPIAPLRRRSSIEVPRAFADMAAWR